MYQLTTTEVIFRTTDGAFIPADEANTDYAAYLAWVADGNEAAPMPVQPAVIPTVVSMRQARLALLEAGLLSAVEDAINALESPDKEAASIEWEYSQEVSRTQPFVVLLSAALSLTEEDLDELFTRAATL